MSAPNVHDVMLQALREVANDHILIETPGVTPVCSHCYADLGEPHELECTMTTVLAAIDVADGRSVQPIYRVGEGTTAVPVQYLTNVGDPRR